MFGLGRNFWTRVPYAFFISYITVPFARPEHDDVVATSTTEFWLVTSTRLNKPATWSGSHEVSVSSAGHGTVMVDRTGAVSVLACWLWHRGVGGIYAGFERPPCPVGWIHADQTLSPRSDILMKPWRWLLPMLD